MYNAKGNNNKHQCNVRREMIDKKQKTQKDTQFKKTKKRRGPIMSLGPFINN
jgi:hypothetical protein